MTEITRKDVARSIDWMGGFNSPIQFDEVDWSGAEADGTVLLSGRAEDGSLVEASVQIAEVVTYAADGDDF